MESTHSVGEVAPRLPPPANWAMSDSCITSLPSGGTGENPVCGSVKQGELTLAPTGAARGTMV